MKKRTTAGAALALSTALLAACSPAAETRAVLDIESAFGNAGSAVLSAPCEPSRWSSGCEEGGMPSGETIGTSASTDLARSSGCVGEPSEASNSAHDHIWLETVETRWVVDEAAWVEYVPSESYVQCSCGARYSSASEWSAHAEDVLLASNGKDVWHSYTVKQNRQAIEHDERGHYEEVVIGYECRSCGMKR